MIICNLNHNKHDTSYYIAWVWDSLKRDWPSLFNASTEKNWNDKRDIIKANNPFKPIPSLNWGQESLTKDFSSSNVENTMDLMDLTIQDIMSIPNEKLCEQVKIAEYLKPKALTEANTGISNAEKAQLLDFYNNTTLIKPCIGEEIDKDEIFSGLCASGEMSLAGLNAASDDKGEILIIDPSFKECKRFLCIYEKLYETGNKLFCTKLYSFHYDENVKLTLKAEKFYGGEGKTSYSADGKEITINLNLNSCNDNPLKIAGTLLHESIHAKIFEEAKQVKPGLTRDDILGIIWNHPKTTDVSHALMAKKYIKILAEALREFDDKRFSVEHYMYLAWEGATLAGKDLGFLKDEVLSEYYSKHQILINADVKICN